MEQQTTERITGYYDAENMTMEFVRVLGTVMMQLNTIPNKRSIPKMREYTRLRELYASITASAIDEIAPIEDDMMIGSNPARDIPKCRKLISRLKQAGLYKIGLHRALVTHTH